MDLTLTSTVYENDGSAALIFEYSPEISFSSLCDDPFVELFRAIRERYGMPFTILVKHSTAQTRCTLLPNNSKGLALDKLTYQAEIALKGDSEKPGIVEEYATLLKNFFASPKGLKRYIEGINSGESSPAIDRSIKSFIAGQGLTVPSFKRG